MRSSVSTALSCSAWEPLGVVIIVMGLHFLGATRITALTARTSIERACKSPFRRIAVTITAVTRPTMGHWFQQMRRGMLRSLRALLVSAWAMVLPGVSAAAESNQSIVVPIKTAVFMSLELSRAAGSQSPLQKAACSREGFRKCAYNCAESLGGYSSAAGTRCMRSCGQFCSGCPASRRRGCRAVE